MGSLTRTVDTVEHPRYGAGAPSVVLAGERADLHLRRLARHGVVPVGRLVEADGAWLSFADDLVTTLRAADANATRFRAQVDAFVSSSGLVAPAEVVDPPHLPRWVATAPRTLDVVREGITSVVWAAGWRRDYSWVDAPVFGAGGEPVQQRGVTSAPGLMFLGLRYMHRRNSNFIDGVGADAAYLAARISGREMTDLAVA
jgi:putative flavoprotein involved in K+ transport